MITAFAASKGEPVELYDAEFYLETLLVFRGEFGISKGKGAIQPLGRTSIFIPLPFTYPAF